MGNTGTARLSLQRLNRPLYLAAALSLVAALLHGWVMPEHFEEWWGYGIFFLVVALAQAVYSIALLRWPQRRTFFLGVAGNLALIGLYLVTRTVGVPFWGPHAGEVEAVGMIDLTSKLVELALVITLIVLLRVRR